MLFINLHSVKVVVFARVLFSLYFMDGLGPIKFIQQGHFFLFKCCLVAVMYLRVLADLNLRLAFLSTIFRFGFCSCFDVMVFNAFFMLWDHNPYYFRRFQILNFIQTLILCVRLNTFIIRDSEEHNYLIGTLSFVVLELCGFIFTLFKSGPKCD